MPKKNPIDRAPGKTKLATERRLFDALRLGHHYKIFDIRPKEQQTSMFQADGQRLRHAPAIAVKLVVLESSWLGREIIKGRTLRTKTARPRVAATKAKR